MAEQGPTSELPRGAGAPARPVGSLRKKLTRLILGQVVVLAVGGALATAYRSASDLADRRASAEARLRQALLRKAHLLAHNQSIAFESLINDYALATMDALVAGTVRADADIQYGLATDERGRLFAFAAAPGFSADVDSAQPLSQANAASALQALGIPDHPADMDGRSPTQLREFDVSGHHLLEMSAPVRNSSGAILGVVRYGFSTQAQQLALAEITASQERALWSGLGSIAVVSVLALALGMWLSLRYSRRIIEPLQELTKAASRLAGGDRGARVTITSGDELQVLGDAFNRMVAELSESYGRLEQSNARLLEEMTVRQRAEDQRLEAEHQLAQAQKMEAVGQLAGGVAHDFNNLLTVIQGHTTLMDMTIQDAEKGLRSALGEHVEGIQMASTRASNLTRQLLAFSRRDQDDPRVIQLAEVVSGIEPMLRRLLRENISLEVEVAPGATWLRADPSRLEQVIINLAVNACDAMPEGGGLTLHVGSADVTVPRQVFSGELGPGTYTRLTVSDTGTGIAAKHLEHLFEPFFTTKEVGKGTGLGLAMVHGIVRGAGGCVDLQSEVGQGTRFTLYFPQVSGSAAAGERAVEGATPRGNGQLVLLCEDDEAVRAITETFLIRHGYAVAAFATPARALRFAQLQGDRIDVLLTDVVMPEMSGPQLARELNTYARVPAVYMSGYTAGALEPYGLAEGTASLVRKPFSPQELCVAVHQALDWKAARTA